MIGFLRGDIVYITENSVVIETSGVGYEVFATKQILLSCKPRDVLELYIYHHVSENAERLYGLRSLEERKFFVLLISVSGIGPKSALDIMEVSVNTIVSAISKEDVAALTELPGVGKKTAERMILELKGKISGIVTSKKIKEIPIDVSVAIHSDVMEALISLGYSRLEATAILQEIPENITDTQEILKYALQYKI